MRAVVHADHSDGVRAGAETFEQQRRHYRHAVPEDFIGRSVLECGLHGGVVVTGKVFDMVALLGYREADHLELRRAEYLAAALPLGRIFRVGAKHVAYSGDYLLRETAVSRHDDAQREVVERLVNLGNHLLVESRDDRDTALDVAGFKQDVREIRYEAAEDVPGTNVYPARVRLRLFLHFLDVECGYADAGLRPL